MGERTNRQLALVALLTSACPTRKVTRDYFDFAQREAADLDAGVLTVLAAGERGYQNLRERIGMDARAGVLLLGQFKVVETALPSAVEDAEFAFYEEILAALQSGNGMLKCIDIKDFRQSGQMEHPYGWIGVELEWQT